MVDLTNKIYTDKDAAREHLEKIRWPNGPFCPHCGEARQIKKLEGKSTRPGVHKCKSCRKPFTVTVGTVFERSKVPLNKWVLAADLMAASKKGISAHQLHRQINVTYKTAWFMEHRLREAMRQGKGGGNWNDPDRMGGDGKAVEADETYIGRKRSRKGEKLPSGYGRKEKVISLVERGGRVRSLHVPAVNARTVRKVLTEQLHPNTKLYTDESMLYRQAKKFFKSHESVNHSAEEYVRGAAHTQTIENYFSILKRGLNGVYQHCSKEHLKRYLGEFDFRYNYRAKLGFNDEERRDLLLAGIGGKRLTYK